MDCKTQCKNDYRGYSNEVGIRMKLDEKLVAVVIVLSIAAPLVIFAMVIHIVLK
jgi:hypothetical protein